MKVVECDGEGIGLFRTEFLFMDRPQIPTEEEQFAAYRKVAETLEGKVGYYSYIGCWRR